ncbi:hypothetical protein HanXRQr2_Chr15g0704701 [Helianthus annuus]|uniref:Uncharacterized protein n=1 Tax=Helianthus annuus TaxID=4232 RepID=A0A9K3H3Y3_HELAN|nr:hypothetical protein HanXRQr2_Chr15g0704701 [Helianthus annuus]
MSSLEGAKLIGAGAATIASAGAAIDIMSLDISRESDASNSVNNPKVSTPNASSSVDC